MQYTICVGDILKCIDLSVADPGFPRRSAPTRGIGEGGGANLLLGIVFAKNCMEMEKKLHW